MGKPVPKNGNPKNNRNPKLLSNIQYGFRLDQFLIVKVGDTFPSIATEWGDFEDWIIRGLGVHRRYCTIYDPRIDKKTPTITHYRGVIVSGSHAMVTERHDWSERTRLLISSIVRGSIPYLGICYGHQLLAHACGGIIGNNPRGREFGTVDITVLKAASTDPLFSALAPSFKGYVCHTQSVLSLPSNACLLARSDKDPHQAFVIGDCAWGVQFHPEFSLPITKAYIDESADDLRNEGRDPNAILCTEAHASETLLRRFANFVLMN